MNVKDYNMKPEYQTFVTKMCCIQICENFFTTLTDAQIRSQFSTVLDKNIFNLDFEN